MITFIILVPRLEVGALRRELISCTNAISVRKLLVKLAGTNPAKPLWTINPRYIHLYSKDFILTFNHIFFFSWVVPMPLQSIIMSMQRAFLQDFAYILVGKAKEMAGKNVNNLSSS